MPLPLRTYAAIAGLFLLTLPLLGPAESFAQVRPPERQVRTYVPPDQLVSFLPTTPFDQFIEFVNPIFSRVTGKAIIDTESRSQPIGISVAGMHFLDAFELVLNTMGLTYRETDRFFLVEEPVPVDLVLDAEAATGRATSGSKAGKPAPATLGTREIQINAVLFEVNLSKARDMGIDWNVFFGESPQSSGSGSGSGGGQNQQQRPQFSLQTKEIFAPFENILSAPDQIQLSTLTQFFRLLENEGVGETIANPQVTVQSSEKGRIQIGSDVPVQTRDFAGNTITQFFSTGIIVDVTPTLMQEAVIDTAGAPLLDFVHLDVKVEKSSGRPSLAGLVIDRNVANTQVLLLDGEQTVIGGLYSTEESVSRRGVPVLKDLPGWFLGLRYVFGYTQKSISQKELLIVLQAKVMDPLMVRAQRPFQEDLIERKRREMHESLRRVDEGLPARAAMPGSKYKQ